MPIHPAGFDAAAHARPAASREPQLDLDFSVVKRPTLKEKEQAVEDGWIGFSRDTSGVKDGVRTREDSRGRQVTEQLGPTGPEALWKANNGLEVFEDPKSIIVAFPNGLQIRGDQKNPAKLLGPQGQELPVSPKAQGRFGDDTVLTGYKFEHEGKRYQVDLTELSFKVTDSDNGISQTFEPTGEQKVEIHRDYRDPITRVYEPQTRRFSLAPETYEVGYSGDDLQVSRDQVRFKNPSDEWVPVGLPIPLDKDPTGPLTYVRERPQLVPETEPGRTPQQQIKNSGLLDDPGFAPGEELLRLEPAEPPRPAPPSASNGPIFQEAPPVPPGPASTVPPGPPQAAQPASPPGSTPGPQPSRTTPFPVENQVKTPSGLVRSSDGQHQQIMLPNNVINVMVRPDGTGFAAGANSPGSPIKVEPFRRPDGGQELAYQFRDGKQNIYTVFSESGDFSVESPDRRVAQKVLPNGNIFTVVQGDQGVYTAQTYPNGQTVPTSPGAQFLPDRVRTPEGEVPLPFPIDPDYHMTTSAGAFGETRQLGDSGFFPPAFASAPVPGGPPGFTPGAPAPGSPVNPRAADLIASDDAIERLWQLSHGVNTGATIPSPPTAHHGGQPTTSPADQALGQPQGFPTSYHQPPQLPGQPAPTQTTQPTPAPQPNGQAAAGEVDPQAVQQAMVNIQQKAQAFDRVLQPLVEDQGKQQQIEQILTPKLENIGQSGLVPGLLQLNGIDPSQANKQQVAGVLATVQTILLAHIAVETPQVLGQDAVAPAQEFLGAYQTAGIPLPEMIRKAGNGEPLQ